MSLSDLRLTLRQYILLLAQRALGFRASASFLLLTEHRLLLHQQLSELLGLQELKCSEDGAEHVTAKAHRKIHIFPEDDAQEDEVRVYLVHFACYFAEDVGDDAEDVV